MNKITGMCTVALLLAGLVLGAAPANAAPAADRVVGVSLPTYHYSTGAVTDWQNATGQDVDVVQTFVSWEYSGAPQLSEFPSGRARDITKIGATLEVTWSPANPAEGNTDPTFSLASIARGDHDAYVTRFARAVKASGQPVRIRFGHEMNGTWTPWNESRSGNRTGQFAAAWRHLHDVFEAQGATNAIWVWSPNILHAGGTDLAGLYPGDAYVDEVGIDGYSYPKTGCPTPAKLFGPTLRAVRAITAEPVRIAEVGVDAACPQRSQWISSFFDYLNADPTITGYTWWERSGSGLDYRIGQRDLAAFRTSAATWS